MKVRELVGLESFFAFQVYHKLLLGLKMLPAYLSVPYETFYSGIELMGEVDQEKLIREAALFVNLDKEEINAMAVFCCDSNGVRYTSENLKSLKPDEIFEIIVAVSMQIAKIKVNFVSEPEKKN